METLTQFLDRTIDEEETFMDIIDLEQDENPQTKFPYKKYYTSMGACKLAKRMKYLTFKEFNKIDPEVKIHKENKYCYSNYRLDVFELEDNHNELCYEFWTPECGVENSHYRLKVDIMNKLESEDLWPDDLHRLCCFYNVISGNSFKPTLILYGESSDYPHNEYTHEVKDKFIKWIKETYDLRVIDLIDGMESE